MNRLREWIDHNGDLIPGGSPILAAANRGFRFGDGLFETMLVVNGRVRLRNFHFERLFAGINLLRFAPPPFTPESLEARVLHLCGQNGHSALARVRLVVYRGDGGLYEPHNAGAGFIIESSALSPGDIAFNPQGLAIGIFPDGFKACDALANCKSNNFLLYALAAIYARERQLEDCLVLNASRRLADSTMANLFYIRDQKIYTPPLSEGCIAGTMRRYLLRTLPSMGFPVIETPVEPEELLSADEVFLSNAIRGIRWVGSFGTAKYRDELSRCIHSELIGKLTTS